MTGGKAGQLDDEPTLALLLLLLGVSELAPLLLGVTDAPLVGRPLDGMLQAQE